MNKLLNFLIIISLFFCKSSTDAKIAKKKEQCRADILNDIYVSEQVSGRINNLLVILGYNICLGNAEQERGDFEIPL